MASKAALKVPERQGNGSHVVQQQRAAMLEKSLQTLRLEQTYALKLLELDHRIIKVRYKRLKENVSKIKSHLPVDDISTFRDLENQGKLTSTGCSGVNLGSRHQDRRGGQAAQPRRGPQAATPHAQCAAHHFRPQRLCVCVCVRQTTACWTCATLNLQNTSNSGPTNAEEYGHGSMPTFRSTSSILHRPRSPFSSHTQTPRRASAPARQNRRLSHISTDSIDSLASRMASKAALKVQRDKEMAAMLYNSKEQRVLEKSLQTLRLEQTYALKLLELDHRIIKVRYKRLKENVSKIKSHLPVDDISTFRDLENQGKLTSTGCSGVNLGSAIKIAAAARRLNLGAGLKRRHRMRSALPTISVHRGSASASASDKHGLLDMRSKSVVSINDPPVVDRIRRSNSITGAFIDAPVEDEDEKLRPSSAFVPHNRRLISRPQTVNGLSSTNSQSANTLNSAHVSSGLISNTVQPSGNTKAHSNTIIPPADSLSTLAIPTDSSSCLANKNKNDSVKPANVFIPIKTLNLQNTSNSGPTNAEEYGHGSMPTFRSTSSILHRPRSPFSSHTQTPRRASAPARQNRRLSHISTDSIDSNLGESSHEERRQELLEEEGVRAATLDQRTRIFLKDVDDYLIRNPPLQASHVAFENGLPEPPRRDSLLEPPATHAGLDSQASNGRSVRFRQRRGEAMPGEDQDITPTFFPEVQYKERLMGLWKDMNKCRYLRVPDDKIDLSGINTLAKDQMKLFETLRTAEAQPLRQAWET
ncbi:hypothetical protein EGW08_005788 [Elysia chlorotica]|uniref:Uncharacterized protein n=1 Tax=Elysia chlorotica TaxID=188477 RepID=A0A3S0ZYY6_ELYCH|nr:hypothetical protein EGW08_005788 [Elysia chlorotica]